jgi:hypothetical protein
MAWRDLDVRMIGAAAERIGILHRQQYACIVDQLVEATSEPDELARILTPVFELIIQPHTSTSQASDA